MSRFKDARDKGGRYLLKQLREDGSFGNPQLGVTEYYKVPTALMVCGFSSDASRLLNWIRVNGFLENGDFGPRPREELGSYYYTYHNAWVIKGAARLGQFDISERGMDFLLDFHDPESGGFYTSPTNRNADTMQDLWVVSGSGWCSIYTGRLDVARGVGEWMQRLMDKQPNYPEELWTVYSQTKGLITEVIGRDDFRYVLTRDESRDQSFFHPGIAAGFLARLYMATAEDKWIDLAREFMRFCNHVGDYHFKLLRAGKVGWAASMMYTLTNETVYRDMAIRVGNNLIEAQSDNGAWEWAASGKTGPNNDATAELVVWLDEIHQAVGQDR